jgi:hypothetical protein
MGAQDQLRLLALLARCMRAKGLDGYQPPSVRYQDHLDDLEDEAAVRAADPVHGSKAARAEAVMAFVALAGGEA